jgi:hypothetical protein
MIRFILRLLGLVLLGAAVVAATVDGARSIAASGLVLTPLGETWFRADPGSLNLVQAVIQRYVLPEIWDPGIVSVLQLPTALVAAVLGALFMLIGLPRERRDPLKTEL